MRDRERAARAWEGDAREDTAACGAGGLTHNFSIHSPSITSVQLEAVMGWTRLCSAGSAACLGPAVAATAATQAASSAVSCGPRRPPAMLGAERGSLAGSVGKGSGRAHSLARPPGFFKEAGDAGATPPTPGSADRRCSQRRGGRHLLSSLARRGHAPSRLHLQLPGVSVTSATAALSS